MPVFRMKASRSVEYSGLTYVGGNAPSSADPDTADGRAKKLNVPGRVRVTVVERTTLRMVDSTISAADGTWRISNLNPQYTYLVFGQDDLGQVNAAAQDWVIPVPMEF